jgi:hypothetical protein
MEEDVQESSKEEEEEENAWSSVEEDVQEKPTLKLADQEDATATDGLSKSADLTL